MPQGSSIADQIFLRQKDPVLVRQAPGDSLCRMSHVTGALAQYLPSPPINSFHVGPLDIRFYAFGYIIGITLAVLITRRRWRALGGDPDLISDIALWVVPAGIIGGRIYFDVTTPADIPHVWYGVFAVWTGEVRIDSSEHFLGLQLNMYIAIVMTLAGLAWFAIAQRRPDRPVAVSPVLSASAAGEAAAREGGLGSTERDSVTTARFDE